MPTSSYTSSAAASAQSIDKYSVSLMWINRDKDEKSADIVSNRAGRENFQYLVNRAVTWVTANPDAQVYLWYDSAMTTETAISNSMMFLTETMAKSTGRNLSNITLRDIREIPCVKNNPDIFTSGVPIYFRVDLLKLIIMVHSIEHDGVEAAIFSDLHVGRVSYEAMMSKEILFDQETLRALREVGFVCGMPNSRQSSENQFLQLYNNHFMLDAVRLCINTNISRVIAILAHPDEGRRTEIGGLNETVFSTMFTEIAPFYHALIENADGIYFKKEYSSTEPFYTNTGDSTRDEATYYKTVAAWKAKEFDRQQMIQIDPNKQRRYEPWVGHGRFVKYYLPDQNAPMKQSFLPHRSMMKYDKPPGTHTGEERDLKPAPPCNDKYYCCEFVEYETPQARKLLKLDKKEIDDQQIVDRILREIKHKARAENQIITLEKFVDWVKISPIQKFFQIDQMGIVGALLKLGMAPEDVQPHNITVDKIREVVGGKIRLEAKQEFKGLSAEEAGGPAASS